jgi:tetratricopeptide (TPR) repeat protein
VAPGHGPGREPEPRRWWDCVAGPGDAGALDRDESLTDQIHFEALRPAYLGRNRRTFEAALAAGVLAAAAPRPGVPVVAAELPATVLRASRQPVPASGPGAFDLAVFRLISAHLRHSDDGPPGSLLLAVRAARRALAADPDDALAYLRLGRAYERLRHQTAERATAADFPLFDQLRRVQAVVALQHAVRLRPDLVPAHELLAGLYQEAGALDLAHRHLTEVLRLTRAAGPRPGETPGPFDARLAALAEREAQLGRQVRELLNLVDTQSFSLDVYGKARLCEARGLPGRALDLLLHSSYTEFGREGALLQLHLLLYTGRTGEVREWTDPAQEAVVGTFNYRWLQTLLGAATGQYDRADDDLRRLVVATADVPELGVRDVPPGTGVALIFGTQLLHGADPLSLPPAFRAALVRRLEVLAGVPRQQADIHTLRGMLAVEQGDIAAAARAFRAAVASSDAADGAPALARHYLALIPAK